MAYISQFQHVVDAIFLTASVGNPPASPPDPAGRGVTPGV
jgi:hypothetical protein